MPIAEDDRDASRSSPGEDTKNIASFFVWASPRLLLKSLEDSLRGDLAERVDRAWRLKADVPRGRGNAD